MICVPAFTWESISMDPLRRLTRSRILFIPCPVPDLISSRLNPFPSSRILNRTSSFCLISTSSTRFALACFTILFKASWAILKMYVLIVLFRDSKSPLKSREICNPVCSLVSTQRFRMANTIPNASRTDGIRLLLIRLISSTILSKSVLILDNCSFTSFSSLYNRLSSCIFTETRYCPIPSCNSLDKRCRSFSSPSINDLRL